MAKQACLLKQLSSSESLDTIYFFIASKSWQLTSAPGVLLCECCYDNNAEFVTSITLLLVCNICNTFKNGGILRCLNLRWTVLACT